jgi:SpoIIAA-like
MLNEMAGDEFVAMADTVHVRIEGDLIHVRNHRSMTVKDLQVLTELYERVREEHGRLFVLYDSSKSEGVERAARRSLTNVANPRATADATAIFGASFAIRTLGNMIERAIVGLGKPSTGIKFFTTEAEARAFLQQERRRVLGDKSFGEK